MTTKLYQIVSQSQMPLMMELAVVTVDTATDVFYTQQEIYEIVGDGCVMIQINNAQSFALNESVLINQILTFFEDPKVKRMDLDTNIPNFFSTEFVEQLEAKGIRYNYNHNSCTRIKVKSGTTKSELLASKRAVINIGHQLICKKSGVDFKFVGSTTNDNKLNFIKKFGIEFNEIVVELNCPNDVNMWENYKIVTKQVTPLELSIPDSSKHDSIIKQLEMWWWFVPNQTLNKK